MHTDTRTLCPICRVREVTFDVETGTPDSDCDVCRMVRYAAPRCNEAGCLEGGHTSTRTVVADYEARTYRCPSCGHVDTAVGFAYLSGINTGLRDADPASGSHWLVGTRREVQERHLLDDAARPGVQSPAALAYARGYLVATGTPVL